MNPLHVWTILNNTRMRFHYFHNQEKLTKREKLSNGIGRISVSIINCNWQIMAQAHYTQGVDGFDQAPFGSRTGPL